MKWWHRWFGERRAQEQWTLSELQSWSEMGLGVGPTSSGLTVTPDRALTVPAVYSCVSVLAQDIGKTPLKLRRRINQDSYEDAVDHPLWEILHDLSNPETTAFTLKQQMMIDLLQHERAYAEIVRVDGRVTALWRLDPCRMRVERNAQRQKVYTYTLDNGQPKVWTFDPSQPPILDLWHPSPIRQCRDLIGSALALQTYVGKFFANGGRPSGVINVPGSIGHDNMTRLRESWNDVYAGAEKVHKVAILEGGMKFEPVAPVNSDAQLNETLQTIRTEIAATFRLPAWKVGDTSKMNYSNMESGAIEYATGTLDPFFVCWEEAIRRDVLTVRQFNQFTVAFDRSSLIRADIKSMHEALATGRQNGFYSANDIRRKIGENPIPADQGGDLYLVNSALTPTAQAGDPSNGIN